MVMLLLFYQLKCLKMHKHEKHVSKHEKYLSDLSTSNVQGIHPNYSLTISNNVKRNSHEQGLIAKKCVATYTDYFLNFKMALYPSALVMKF